MNSFWMSEISSQLREQRQQLQIQHLKKFRLERDSNPWPCDTGANDQLPVGLTAQLVRALHRYRKVRGSNPVQAWIFLGLVFATADVAHVTATTFLLWKIFLPQFTYMKFSYNHIQCMSSLPFLPPRSSATFQSQYLNYIESPRTENFASVSLS